MQTSVSVNSHANIRGLVRQLVCERLIRTRYRQPSIAMGLLFVDITGRFMKKNIYVIYASDGFVTLYEIECQ